MTVTAILVKERFISTRAFVLVFPCITLISDRRSQFTMITAPDAKQVARRSLAHHFRGLGWEFEPAALTVLASLWLRLERLGV